MALPPGTRLGPYEILSPLGAGGMGEVYRAKDTRLDRTVAIKVLPSHLSADQDRRQRFEREARAISSLNHPHICTLHDIGHHDGTDFLVMEHLEGETLDYRLAKGPLPVDQVLRYAIEIADALDKAHRQGIIHRDLKPGNIMLTKSGAKLLDFGLAKLRQSDAHAAVANLSALPTEASRPLTGEGTILGTFQYMAPEQLEGKEADTRTDIFAFGVVVYEMATGKKAFEGKSQASLIAAILDHDPPPISTLEPMSPPVLDRVVKNCLAKDPDDRWQSAHDLTSELKWISEAGSQAGVPAPLIARRRSRERLGWIVGGILLIPLIAALSLAVVHLREVPEKAPVIRFSIAPPQSMGFRFYDQPAVSPDGLRIVFPGVTSDGKDLLWLRSLDSFSEQPLPGTEGASFPFWSPDSRSIGFFSSGKVGYSSGGKLRKIEVAGGPPQTLCDYTYPIFPAGGTWSRSGMIVFAPDFTGPLYQVSAAGGEAKPLTTLDRSRKEISHRWPYFLSDGRHFLYLSTSTRRENQAIYLGSLDSKETKSLSLADSSARYAPPGYLLFVRGDALMAQPFDVKALQTNGEARNTGEQVAWLHPEIGPAFSVSENGVLVYRRGSAVNNTRLAWFDRTGRELGSIGEVAEYSGPALSPDGSRLAIGRRAPQTKTRDIWLFDLTRSTSLRFTFDPAEDLNPVFSPDGKRIMFASERRGHRDIYQKAVGGPGEDELLLESSQNKFVDDWSSDGRFVVYDTAGQSDLWVWPLFGDRKPFPFLQTSFDERQAQISANGRWLAYSSNESDQYEVYVQSFPTPGGKVKISTAGGSEPRWRRGGKELFYLAGKKMMAVEVKTNTSALEVGIPKVLFETPLFPSTGGRNRYVVSPDGQRFLINRPAEESLSSPITVVVNWAAGLKP